MLPLVKLLVIHSQPLFCDRFFELFRKANGIKEIHRATSATDAKEILNTIKLNLLFLYDLLEDFEITQFVRNVKVNFADITIILFTMSRDVSYIKKMKKLGVKGFVHASADRKIIKRGIDAVAEGNFHYCPVFSNIIGDDDKKEDIKVIDVKAFFGFTAKEWDVFKMKVNRKPLTDIAEKMGWVYDTAKDYSSKVLKKVQAKEYEDEIDYVLKTGYSVEI